MPTPTRQRPMLCIAAIAALLLSLCSVCSDNNIGGAVMERKIDAAPRYSLDIRVEPNTNWGSVSRDISSSSYLSGTVVRLTANPYNGYKFKSWSGVSGEYGYTSTTATVKMDGNKEVTAYFEPITYTVTLSNAGTGAIGGGDYAAGETVTITVGAPPTGQRFKNWASSSGGVAFADANSPTTTFNMPPNAATVSAVFENIPPGQYAVTVLSVGNGAIGSGSYTVNTTVTIYAGAAPEGQRFVNWASTDDGVTFREAKSATTTFIMPARPVTATAVFEAITYAVMIANAGAGATGAGDYAAGATVTITAGTPPDGQRFKNWTTASSGVSFANANNAATSFIMPPNAVTVAAVFEDIPAGRYAVTVLNAGAGVLGNGSYEAGATVIIFAGTAPDGQRFKNWTTSSNGVNFANTHNSTTTFIMPANAVAVTANFRLIVPDGDGGALAYYGQNYRTVIIDSERWMAENMNYRMSSGSWCYGEGGQVFDSNIRDYKTLQPAEIEANCDKYGRLYDWGTAMKVCPSGWHLPDTTEWRRLEAAAGGSSVAGKKLKATSGWEIYNGTGGNNGTDDYGFTALAGGYRDSDGSFGNAGYGGNWWTATESGNLAYRRFMNNYDDIVDDYYYEKENGNSVRCVED